MIVDPRWDRYRGWENTGRVSSQSAAATTFQAANRQIVSGKNGITGLKQITIAVKRRRRSNISNWELPAMFDVAPRIIFQDRGNNMKKLLISTAVVVAAFAGPSAFAQTSEFYVVRDATTKKCTIVDKKPTTTTTTVVDNGTFKTRTEAETGMKTMKVCTEH
jgi:hypothetical protein